MLLMHFRFQCAEELRSFSYTLTLDLCLITLRPSLLLSFKILGFCTLGINLSWTLLLNHYYTPLLVIEHLHHCVTHNLGSVAMVGMAARVDIANAAANSAQKITTTKVQIVGSTGSTATKELPCTKNRKSNNPNKTVS